MIICCGEPALANALDHAIGAGRDWARRRPRKEGPDQTTPRIVAEKANEMGPRIGVSLKIWNEPLDSHPGANTGKEEAEHFGV